MIIKCCELQIINFNHKLTLRERKVDTQVLTQAKKKWKTSQGEEVKRSIASAEDNKEKKSCKKGRELPVKQISPLYL